MKEFIEMINKYQPSNEHEEKDKEVILTFCNQHDNAFDRKNNIAHITSSSWIVNKERTKVLLIYHNLYDSWGWCGGHNDNDQDCLNVAKKEAMEETSIQTIQVLSSTPISLEVLPVWCHYKKGVFVNSHLHLNVTYLFEADETAPIQMKEDENSDVAWILVEEVQNIVREPQMIPIYHKLMQLVNRIDH